MKTAALKLRQGSKRAVLYLRRSTNRQEQSLRRQRKACLAYTKAHGYTVVGEYVDDAISGTSVRGRKDFLRMMEDAKSLEHPFDAIIVADVSRFSRGDLDEVGHYRYILKKHGVEVCYANDNFRGDRSDDLVRSCKQSEAHQKSIDLSRDTLDGQVTSAGEGWWNGGVPPFGYDLEYVDQQGNPYRRVTFLMDSTKQMLDLASGQLRLLDPDEKVQVSKKDHCRLVLSSPDRVVLIQRIFDLYRHGGFGFRRIADLLNREGIPSPRGGNWSVGTIRAIILNRIYAGDMIWNRRVRGTFHKVQNGEVVERSDRDAGTLVVSDEEDWVIAENVHPAIIDRKTFFEAQRLLQQRRESRGSDAYRHGRAMNSDFLLSGMMRCTRCGHAMIGETIGSSKMRKDGTRIVTQYYVCAGYKNKGNSVCQRAPIRIEVIHRYVLERIGKQVDTILSNGGTRSLRDLVVKELEANQPDTEGEREQAEKELGSAETKIDRLVDALASMDSVNRDVINAKLKTLVKRRDMLKSELEELESMHPKEVDCDAIADEIMASVRGFNDLFSQGTPEEKKEFIRLWLDDIVFHPDERRARVHMKRFPAPSQDTGKSSFRLVAGARYTHQKRNFPPIDVIDIQFEYQGKALVPVGV